MRPKAFPIHARGALRARGRVDPRSALNDHHVTERPHQRSRVFGAGAQAGTRHLAALAYVTTCAFMVTDWQKQYRRRACFAQSRNTMRSKYIDQTSGLLCTGRGRVSIGRLGPYERELRMAQSYRVNFARTGDLNGPGAFPAGGTSCA